MISRHLSRLLLALALTATGQAHAANAVDAAQRQAWREQAQGLEHGEGVKRDTEAAIRLYCQAALAGDAVSAYNLGWLNANGRGVGPAGLIDGGGPGQGVGPAGLIDGGGTDGRRGRRFNRQVQRTLGLARNAS